MRPSSHVQVSSVFLVLLETHWHTLSSLTPIHTRPYPGVCVLVWPIIGKHPTKPCSKGAYCHAQLMLVAWGRRGCDYNNRKKNSFLTFFFLDFLYGVFLFVSEPFFSASSIFLPSPSFYISSSFLLSIFNHSTFSVFSLFFFLLFSEHYVLWYCCSCILTPECIYMWRHIYIYKGFPTGRF